MNFSQCLIIYLTRSHEANSQIQVCFQYPSAYFKSINTRHIDINKQQIVEARFKFIFQVKGIYLKLECYFAIRNEICSRIVLKVIVTSFSSSRIAILLYPLSGLSFVISFSTFCGILILPSSNTSSAIANANSINSKKNVLFEGRL